MKQPYSSFKTTPLGVVLEFALTPNEVELSEVSVLTSSVQPPLNVEPPVQPPPTGMHGLTAFVIALTAFIGIVKQK